ncbi:hypothetical protein ES708_30773 [subsurface metagenome]
MPSPEERALKRDNLYWDRRYRKGSYKAKKMNLEPILLTIKRGSERLRIYGDPHETIEPVKLRIVRAKCRAWRQKERELRRLAQSGRRDSGSQKVPASTMATAG